MCHSGTDPQPDRGNYAEDGGFTLIRSLYRLSFLQYHPRPRHYALRDRLRHGRLLLRFFRRFRRASCLGTGRIAGAYLLLYGTGVSPVFAVVVRGRPSVVLFFVYPLGDHVGRTGGVLFLGLYSRGKFCFHAQRVAQRWAFLAFFHDCLCVFLPTVGEYLPSVRLLFAFAHFRVVGRDELRRVMGDGRADGVDFFVPLRGI